MEDLYTSFSGKTNPSDVYLKNANAGDWETLSTKRHSVVFMPSASLMSKKGLDFTDQNSKHRKVIVIFDEAHHVGATKFFRWINEKKDIILLGLTATPLSENKKFNSFWIRKFSTHQDLEEENAEIDLMAQTREAIKKGHILYPDAIHYFDVDKIEGEENAIRIKDPQVENLYMLNPVYYPQIAENLEEIFIKNKYGFIKVSTQNEARLLNAFLNTKYPHIGFGIYTSNEKDSKNTLEDFLADRIHYLIAIQKLKEGADFPKLRAFIDMSFTDSILSNMQNLGRVVRPEPGKYNVDWVRFTEISVEEMFLATQKYLENNQKIQHTDVTLKKTKNNLKISLNQKDVPLLMNLSLIHKNLSFDRYLSPAEKVVNFFKKNQQLPSVTTDSNIYGTMTYAVRNNKDQFLKDVRNLSKECYDAIQILIQVRNPAQKIVDFFIEHKKLPSVTADPNTYGTMKYAVKNNKDKFLEDVRNLSEECYDAIQNWMQNVERKAKSPAQKVVHFFVEHKKLPSVVNDKSIYLTMFNAIRKNKDQFLREVEALSAECAEAIQNWIQNAERKANSPSPAQKIVDFFVEHKTLPSYTKDEKTYALIPTHVRKDKDKFLEEIRDLSEECYDAIQNWIQNAERKANSPAQKIVDFFVEHKTLPSYTKDKEISRLMTVMNQALKSNKDQFLEDVRNLSEECYDAIQNWIQKKKK